MKKIVPDPPEIVASKTAETIFGHCGTGHPPLFTVRSGISAEDALVHAALYLKCACDRGPLALGYTAEPGRGFAQATLHSIAMANGLINAVLDGIESRVWEKTANANANSTDL